MMPRKKKSIKKIINTEDGEIKEVTVGKRIRGLSCYENVEEMLYAGYPIPAIARYIQQDSKEYTDVTIGNLIAQLYKYRDKLAEGGFIQHSLPRFFGKVERKFSDKLKELDRLEDLYESMEYMHDLVGAKIRMSDIYDPEFARIAKSMMDIVIKQHNIKMDLGISGSRDLGTLNISAEKMAYIKDKYGDGAAKAFADPVSRGKVIAALGAMYRAGKLKNKDGDPIKLTERLELSDEEKEDVIDIHDDDIDFGVEHDYTNDNINDTDEDDLYFDDDIDEKTNLSSSDGKLIVDRMEEDDDFNCSIENDNIEKEHEIIDLSVVNYNKNIDIISEKSRKKIETDPYLPPGLVMSPMKNFIRKHNSGNSGHDNNE